MTVDEISSNPPLVEWHVRFTMVPFILMGFFNSDFSAEKKTKIPEFDTFSRWNYDDIFLTVAQRKA